jgi:hypothetical protein
MRLVQFRRHLDGYCVRVSDAADIATLKSTPGFEELVTIRELSKCGDRTKALLLSCEFYSKPPDVDSMDQWRTWVWGILRYRKRKND